MKTKNFAAFLGMLFLTLSLNAQRSVDNIFRKYQNDSDVMYMDMGGNFAQFLENEGEEIKSEIEKVKLMVFSKGKNMDSDDLDDLKASLQGGDYELLVQANNKEGNVRIYVVDSGDFFTEIFGMVQSNEYNVYARLYGKMYYEDLTKLSMNMGGAGNLGDFLGK